MLDYPWYTVVEGEELEQGDFIDNCSVVVPQYTSLHFTEENTLDNRLVHQIEGIVEVYDVIIVNQSCDLENNKLDYVIMCPRWSCRAYAEVNEEFKKLDKLEQIRQGKQHRYGMLNQSELDVLSYEIQIVDLSMVFSVPYNALKQIAKSNGKRLRLLSPYKEKLAQSFAYYYMRIALPNDIPRFEKRKESR